MVQISEDVLTIATVRTASVISELKTQVIRLQNKEVQQDEELRILRKQNMEHQCKIEYLMNFVTKLRKFPASDVSIPTSSSISLPGESASIEIPVLTSKNEEAEDTKEEKVEEFMKEKTPEPVNVARHVYTSEDGYLFEDIGDMEDFGVEELKVMEAGYSRTISDYA
jgi:hypothetical protein